MKANKEIINIRMRRVGAAIVDWYLSTMLASTSVTLFSHHSGPLDSQTFSLVNYSTKNAIFIGIYAIIVGIIYYMIIPKILFLGQTFGKRIFKIKVIHQNDTEIKWSTLFKREILGSTFLEGGITVTSIYLRQLLTYFLGFPFKYLIYPAYIITILSIMYAYIKPDTLMFHDLIAKTKVVRK